MPQFLINREVRLAPNLAHTQTSIEADRFEHENEFIVFYSHTPSGDVLPALVLRADDVHTIERVDA